MTNKRARLLSVSLVLAVVLAVWVAVGCEPARAASCLPGKTYYRYWKRIGYGPAGLIKGFELDGKPVVCMEDGEHVLGCWNLDVASGALQARAIGALPSSPIETSPKQERVMSTDGRHVAIVHNLPPSSVDIEETGGGKVVRHFAPDPEQQLAARSYIDDTLVLTGYPRDVQASPVLHVFRDDGTRVDVNGFRVHQYAAHQLAFWDEAFQHLELYDTKSHEVTRIDAAPGRAPMVVYEVLPTAAGLLVRGSVTPPAAFARLDRATLGQIGNLQLTVCKE